LIVGLLNRLRTGDQPALAELFSLYREPLRRMVELRLDHRLNGRVSPSDVLQEAYIDALERFHHYFDKPDLPFFGWLRLVTCQSLADVHRQHLDAKRRAVSQEVSLYGKDVPAASSVCLAAHLVGHLTSPSVAAQRNETLARLEEGINRMDPLDREVLAMRHFEELSNQEVAEALGITTAAASKRYVRALARLKEVLAGLPDFGPDST
jgi:RNA polymerase sigma-70 factor (ECF subfamily)